MVFPLAAETTAEQADRLYEEDKNREAYNLLKTAIPSAGSGAERAELLWRLARSTMEVGDLMEVEGAPESDLLAVYVEGEGYAEEAISSDPKNHNSYYWKSANIGRWAEVKGIVNSLFKAKPMRDLLRQALNAYPEHPNSFYVLGIMYERVPGWPISFGEADYAVSLGRKAVDANLAEIAAGLEDEVKIVYTLELARHLMNRGWDVKKRNKERAKKVSKYARESDVLEKNLYYEGAVEIPDMSDEEEALELVKWVIAEFGKLPVLRQSHKTDLAEARADLAEWTE